jgi:hypothetical protein
MEPGMPRYVGKVIVGGEEGEVPVNTDSGDKEVDGARLNTPGSAVIFQLSGFDIITTVNFNHRKRSQNLNQNLELAVMLHAAKDLLQNRSYEKDTVFPSEVIAQGYKERI